MAAPQQAGNYFRNVLSYNYQVLARKYSLFYPSPWTPQSLVFEWFIYYHKHIYSICRADGQFEMITWKPLHSVSTGGTQTWQTPTMNSWGFVTYIALAISLGSFTKCECPGWVNFLTSTRTKVLYLLWLVTNFEDRWVLLGALSTRRNALHEISQRPCPEVDHLRAWSRVRVCFDSFFFGVLDLVIKATCCERQWLYPST